MFTIYVAVVGLTVAANGWMATRDLARDDQVLRNMTAVGLDHRWVVALGLLKAAGAAGLAIGLVLPPIGSAAALGLVAFFVGAVATHLRAREYSLGFPLAYLALAAASLVLHLVVR